MSQSLWEAAFKEYSVAPWRQLKVAQMPTLSLEEHQRQESSLRVACEFLQKHVTLVLSGNFHMVALPTLDSQWLSPRGLQGTFLLTFPLSGPTLLF